MLDAGTCRFAVRRQLGEPDQQVADRCRAGRPGATLVAALSSTSASPIRRVVADDRGVALLARARVAGTAAQLDWSRRRCSSCDLAPTVTVVSLPRSISTPMPGLSPPNSARGYASVCQHDFGSPSTIFSALVALGAVTVPGRRCGPGWLSSLIRAASPTGGRPGAAVPTRRPVARCPTRCLLRRRASGPRRWCRRSRCTSSAATTIAILRPVAVEAFGASAAARLERVEVERLVGEQGTGGRRRPRRAGPARRSPSAAVGGRACGSSRSR